MNLSGTQIGMVSEMMVMKSFFMAGHSAFVATPHLPYDLVADVDGLLIKVQVKCVTGPTKRMISSANRPYLFNLLRKTQNGRRFRYKPTDFDIFAFVALDIEQIAFIPSTRVLKANTTTIYADDYVARTDSKPSVKRFGDYPLHKAIKAIQSGENHKTLLDDISALPKWAGRKAESPTPSAGTP